MDAYDARAPIDGHDDGGERAVVACRQRERLARARDAGIRDDALCADPGIGFAKLPRHNLELLARLPELYSTLSGWLAESDERVLIHHEEFGDRLLGVLAGYLLYSGLVAEGPNAVVVIEKITGRQLGSLAREIVAVTVDEVIVPKKPKAVRRARS